MEENIWPNSYEELIDLIINHKITVSMIDEKFKEIIKKAEKNNYNDKNMKNIDKDNIFGKLYQFQNMLDFKRNISSFILSIFSVLSNYNIQSNKQIKDLIDSFNGLKNECLVEMDLNLVNFSTEECINILFTIPKNYLNDILNLFDYSEIIIDSIDIIINKINDLIEKSVKTNVIKKYIILLMKKIDEKKNDIKKEELLHGIFIDKMFNNFKGENFLINNIYPMIELLKYYPSYIEQFTKYLIEKREIKQITRIILKENFQEYLSKETLERLKYENEISTFYFYLHSYENKSIRLINFYDLFNDKTIFLEKLSEILKAKNKLKQSDLILNKQYTEELDMELELYNEDDYIKLPKNILDNTKFISSNNLEEGLIFLDNFKKYEIIGIDTEWKPKISIFEDFNKERESDIIQIACEDYAVILDSFSFKNEQKLKDKFIEVFNDKVFIGFYFQGDIKEMNIFFKNFFQNNQKLKDLKDIYLEKTNKKSPDLNTLCKIIFNKSLNKIDQLSNWKKRPLNRNQIMYGVLDAYILILLYKELTSQNKLV